MIERTEGGGGGGRGGGGGGGEGTRCVVEGWTPSRDGGRSSAHLLL